jgi:hypothetical protein
VGLDTAKGMGVCSVIKPCEMRSRVAFLSAEIYIPMEKRKKREKREKKGKKGKKEKREKKGKKGRKGQGGRGMRSEIDRVSDLLPS